MHGLLTELCLPTRKLADIADPKHIEVTELASAWDLSPSVLQKRIRARDVSLVRPPRVLPSLQTLASCKSGRKPRATHFFQNDICSPTHTICMLQCPPLRVAHYPKKYGPALDVRMLQLLNLRAKVGTRCFNTGSLMSTTRQRWGGRSNVSRATSTMYLQPSLPEGNNPHARVGRTRFSGSAQVGRW